jgi:glycosyltransferase involved in cell wall biosynthesis
LKISVITASLNCIHTIPDAIESVVSQKYVDIEHVVIDGNSTDGTKEFITLSQKHLSKFISEVDNGLYFALNKGVSVASGDVVGFLHADDIFHDDDVLTKVANAFADSTVQAVYGDLVYVDKLDITRIMRKWHSGEFSDVCLLKGWMPPHPTLFLRRSLYEKLGVFDTRYRIAADYDFILRVLSQLTPEQVGYIPEVLVKMRIGGVSNRSLKLLLQKSWEDYQIIRKHKVGGLGTLLRKNFSKLPQFFYKIN